MGQWQICTLDISDYLGQHFAELLFFRQTKRKCLVGLVETLLLSCSVTDRYELLGQTWCKPTEALAEVSSH